MRLVGALDAILTVIAFGRKQLCDLINSACRATTIDPRVEHALADLEPVIAQANIRREDKDLRPAVETDQKRRYFWVHAEFYHGQRPERDCFECGLDAHGKERTASLEGAPSDAEHGIGLGCAPKVNPARQIAACPENGLGLWCGRSSMGGCEWLGLRSASGAKSERFVRCSQTPDLPGGSGRSGSSGRESVPTDPRRNACFWQLVQESPTSPNNGRCVRFRACRQM